MKKFYTVTGGTGYIGSKVLEHLSKDENNYIYAIVRESSKAKVEAENIEYVVFDGTEESIQNAIEISDYLIHLAALYDTRTDESTTKNLIESNILFSTMLFNIASRVNPDISIASTSTFSSLSEEEAYAPSSLYAATKSAVETIAGFYSDLSVHFLTLPDTYGPGDWRNKVHNLVQRNENWPFQFRSPAAQPIRLLHVEDVIGHILASMEDKSKGVHIHDIYSTGILLTLRELSNILTDNQCLFNNESPIVKIPVRSRPVSKETGYKVKYNKVIF